MAIYPYDIENEECSEFVVVPPEGARFDDPLLQKQIEDDLHREFPNRRFTVTTAGKKRFKDFFVAPVIDGNHPLVGMPMIDTFWDFAVFLHRYVSREPPRQ
ncbi:hypothetical protein MPL3356_70334 [Mesorhizobium plurifarium]|uniref:Uncharacterized protein n=1 Tax=Mesorhizobium plurifarium TaxID=69974 RepID=A0A090ECS0_MESPL|nr:hypothetical protein MPL3356_70334 [Mesorhizobium plurifarium]